MTPAKNVTEWLTNQPEDMVQIGSPLKVEERNTVLIGLRALMAMDLRDAGGPGSGYYNHPGRPGQIGGSAPGSGISPEDQAIIDRPASFYTPVFAAGRDSLEKFADPNGNFPPERQALHDAIVRGIFVGIQPENHPSAIVFGGGTAAGKTTIEKQYEIGHGNIGVINVDTIRNQLPEYRESVAHMKATGVIDEAASSFSHEEASVIGKEALRYARERKLPVVLDGTGDSTLEKLGGKIAALRGAGYKIHGEYVTVPTQMALDRAHARSLKHGPDFGRKVYPSVVKFTHRAVSRILPEAVRQGLFDTWRLHDTRGQTPEVIAHGRKKTVVVDNQEKWGEFLEKAHEEW